MIPKAITPKNQITYLITLIGIVYLSMACTDEKLVYNALDEAYKSLQGEWQWIKTNSPRTRSEFTPASEGYQEKIVFKTNDTVEYYRDEVLSHKYPYQLKYRIDNSLDANSDSTLVLVINKGTESYFSTENDTLIINQSYVDGPVTYYRKRN
ncbi:hypothetical protein [Marinifilum fragile]|uniref:hypothetical protein n=1 Tax=Marinifilum fragile TaxID=570161 RepID=UPI002AA65F03|nr:hypothetical protein [Marinifilum fragile]